MQEKNQQETYICNLRKTEDILPEKICLNQYLDGIEVYVECNFKRINFANKIKDLNGNFHPLWKNRMIIFSILKIKNRKSIKDKEKCYVEIGDKIG